MNSPSEAAAVEVAPKYESAFWIGFARWGARNGPRWFLRLAPVVIGFFFAIFLGDTRRSIVRNQRRLFGRRSALVEFWAAVKTFTNFAACLAEALSERPWEVEAEGAERLAAAIEATERGVVILTAHVGPWDSTARGLAGLGERKVMVVMNEERDRGAGSLVDAAREQAGVRVVRLGTDHLSALPVLQHLQAGGVAALQMDRAPVHRGVAVARLGSGAFPVAAGPFHLARISGAPLLPVFSVQVGFLRKRVCVGEPVEVPARASPEELEVALGEVVSQFEAHVRAVPEQWFHFVSEQDERAALEKAAREPWTARRRKRASR